MQHVLFHDGSPHSEGAGAKWREVKYGLWLSLRLNWLLQGKVGNTTLAWLPNPAMMQNPHVDEYKSMMGGLGLLDAGAPVNRESPAWLHERVREGAFKVVELRAEKKRLPPLAHSPRQVARTGHTDGTDRALEQQALAALATASQPVAFFLDTSAPMHWHGSAGRWLHDAFLSHRLRRAERATGRAELALPAGVDAGRFVVAVHIRHFGVRAWDLPGSYFVSAVQAAFEGAALSCETAAVLVIGPVDAPAATSLASAFECAHLIGRAVKEDRSEPSFDKHAADDYSAHDDHDDERRGYVFRDLELLALSDVLVGSNSEFSRLAQSISAPDTIVLCAPRRPDSDNFGLNRGLRCDETGVPNSIVTRLDSLPSDRVAHVDTTRVAERVAEAWRRRSAAAAAGGLDRRIWARPQHGHVPFDFALPIEEARWHDSEEAAQAFAAAEATRGKVEL